MPLLRHETFPGITDKEVPDDVDTDCSISIDHVTAHAAAHGAVTVDFFSTTIFENSLTLSDDGNHPNGRGMMPLLRYGIRQ
jgi:lysophospholipase L1-like esterase